MESLEIQYDKLLIRLFGTQIEKDLEVLKQKFSFVVAAHLFADSQGKGLFSQLNQLLIKGIERR